MSHQRQPTVVGVANFNAAEDAAALLGAMKGCGSDEQAIIEILTSRSNAQRQDIAQAFKREYGRDIIKDLKSALGGHFEDVIVALMSPPTDYLCAGLHSCLETGSRAEHTLDLFEILCTRTNKEIAEIVDAYERLYNRPLAENIRSGTTEFATELLKLIITGARDEEAGVDQTRAEEDAQELFDAGQNKWGTDAEVFFEIMARRSFAHLRVTFELYKDIAGRTIEQHIKADFDDDQDAFLAIVECVENGVPAWFAKRLRAAVEGAGTDDAALVRIIASRAEIDLGAIKREYERLYDKTLESDVKGETSGDYKRALVALLGPA